MTKKYIIETYKTCKRCHRKLSYKTLILALSSWLSQGGYVMDEKFSCSCGALITTNSELL